jgi:hypothetical protein
MVGSAFTVALVVADAVHPLLVTVTVYVPVAAVVAEAIEGSSPELAKAFGPDQL